MVRSGLKCRRCSPAELEVAIVGIRGWHTFRSQGLTVCKQVDLEACIRKSINRDMARSDVDVQRRTDACGKMNDRV